MNDSKIELEWSYKPPDYVEERIVWNRQNYSVEIADGHIIAHMDAGFFESKPELRELLTRELNDYFYGALPYRRRPFEISRGSISRIWPDGRRDTTLEVQVGSHVFAGMNVDLIHTGADGKVIGDTRRERIEATMKLAELSSRYAPTDPTVRRILDSFDAAVRYPGNELICLYEVWEALQTRFRGDGKARKALGIIRDDRSRLTKLADKEPLNQGRHRGKFAGKLRNATASELDEAWAIARGMYEKYLSYLNMRDESK
jgi:hypothetical protein